MHNNENENLYKFHNPKEIDHGELFESTEGQAIVAAPITKLVDNFFLEKHVYISNTNLDKALNYIMNKAYEKLFIMNSNQQIKLFKHSDVQLRHYGEHVNYFEVASNFYKVDHTGAFE